MGAGLAGGAGLAIASVATGREAGGEFRQDLRIDRALEGHDAVEEVVGVRPGPAGELGMRGGDVYVGVGAVEAEEDPLLLLSRDSGPFQTLPRRWGGRS
jgi:hypothetical protein